MFNVTETAKTELHNRLALTETNQFIRLQMRKSCFMKLKLTLEVSVEPNDSQVIIDDLHFIIDNNECHYFRNKTIDFVPDQTGFKQFEAI